MTSLLLSLPMKYYC